jgi:hypothetical protein
MTDTLSHTQFQQQLPGMGKPTVATKVVPGKVKGTYSISCSQCGYSGGNYPHMQTARTLSEKHRTLPHRM